MQRILLTDAPLDSVSLNTINVAHRIESIIATIGSLFSFILSIILAMAIVVFLYYHFKELKGCKR